jgi:hypothetical protein
MEEQVRRGVRVRPWFRRALRIVLPMLLLAGGCQVWDDAEVRRLSPLVERVEAARRKPPAPTTPAGSDDADRFYAGAIAAVYFEGFSPFAVRERVPEPMLARNADTLRLLDTGAALPFRRLSGLSPTAHIGRTLQVNRMAASRTLQLVERGDTPGAVRSLVNQIRFLRALEDTDLGLQVRTSALRGAASDLGTLLSRLTPTRSDLLEIDGALASIYEGDALASRLAEAALFRLQALQLGRSRTRLAPLAVASPGRPLLLNTSVAMLTTTSDALDLALRPWPEPIVGVERLVDRRPLMTSYFTIMWTITPAFQYVVHSYAEGLAYVRAGRAAVAAQMQTKVDGPDAIDPFSGKPLLIRQEPNGYVVYSLGGNRRDDGGTLTLPPPTGGAGWSRVPPTDFGVRVTGVPLPPPAPRTAP